jgi:sugar phosphate isomerase/epimerase
VLELGIFAKTFTKPFSELLDTILGYDLHLVHFNMSCLGLASMPDELDVKLCENIKAEFSQRHLTMIGLSGTYNMIHPYKDIRQQGLAQLAVLAKAARPMGTDLISLCTGTRNPDHQWQHHPDNSRAKAWQDLCQEIEKALELAETYDLTLAIEPEQGNVVSSAQKAETLLKEMASDRLKVIIDLANLLPEGETKNQRAILEDALERLAPYLCMAHAKEQRDTALGEGKLDFSFYLASLKAVGFSGPTIMHGLKESQVAKSLTYLRAFL